MIMKNLNIRKLKESEYKILDNFLYEAIFIPKGIEKPPREIINNEELQVYVKNFGTVNSFFFYTIKTFPCVQMPNWQKAML